MASDAPPQQSLIGPLLPLVDDMQDSVQAATACLEGIPAWDGNEHNHEQVLHSLQDVRDLTEQWQRALTNRLQALWMDQAAEYNGYKKQIEKTLRLRHLAELECMFPNLRTTRRDADSLLKQTSDEVEHGNIKHLIGLGYLYDKESEGATGKLTILCQRQIQERTVFDTTTTMHSEQLLTAKRGDLQRLRNIIQKTTDHVETVARQVEQKIAASQRMASNAVYRKSHQAHHHGASTSSVGGAAQPGTASSLQGSNRDKDLAPPSVMAT